MMGFAAAQPIPRRRVGPMSALSIEQRAQAVDRLGDFLRVAGKA
jgi:hypothetical protein